MRKLKLGIQDGETKRPNPLHLYCGELDLINGSDPRWRVIKSIVIKLKMDALFFDKLIVHDGAFHCYGPIHYAFSEDQKPLPTKESLRETIDSFMQADRLVPAIREGKSL